MTAEPTEDGVRAEVRARLFNEVFLDEARVPHANLVGELNGG